MTLAILLAASLVLAAAVGALWMALLVLRRRVEELMRQVVGQVSTSPGLVTGAGAPSSTSGGAGATSSGDPSVGELDHPPSRDQRERRTPDEYVITRIGEEPVEPAPTIESRLFADIVLRESVVKAASFAHGVRRGLSAENRNRIRFEMRREVKRARKQRKSEEREAIREWRARQRAGVRPVGHEENAA
jgi:hypothetical protein